MVRVCLTGWAVFLIVWALLVTQAAHAGPTAAAPADHPEGECAWTQNGDEVVVDGFTYMCMCELVHQVGEYWCHWQFVSAPERAKKQVKRHAKPKTTKRPTHGIGTAILYIHAPKVVAQ